MWHLQLHGELIPCHPVYKYESAIEIAEEIITPAEKNK
jgi:hypothetical protein